MQTLLLLIVAVNAKYYFVDFNYTVHVHNLFRL